MFDEEHASAWTEPLSRPAEMPGFQCRRDVAME
jgi:hypothetical protein